MCDKNEINIHWISKQHQLSDVLTKKGASVHSLVKVLQKGKIERYTNTNIYVYIYHKI